MIDSKKIPIFGIQKLSGFARKKIEVIIKAKGYLVICSAMC